jgi:hypothetical protein
LKRRIGLMNRFNRGIALSTELIDIIVDGGESAKSQIENGSLQI